MSDFEGLILSPMWTLKVNTWAGAVPGASHYMARLKRPIYLPDEDDRGPFLWSGSDNVEVEYTLTRDDARALSTGDFRWHAGDTSTRFFDRDSAVTAALARFAEIAEPGDWLVRDWSYEDGDDLLAGTPGKWERPSGSMRMGVGNPLSDRRFDP